MPLVYTKFQMFGRFRNPFKKKPDEVVAVIILEREPRHITTTFVESLCRHLDLQAEVAEIGVSNVRLITDGWTIEIFSYDNPYPPFDGEVFPDLRMAQAVNDHSCFVVVECKGAPKGHDRKDIHDLLNQFAYLIADEHSLAFYDWVTAFYVVLTLEKLASLAQKDYDGDIYMSSEPVLAVETVDVEQAIIEARRRWPEFCAAFANRTAEGKFTVKAAFRGDADTEHMWINPTAVYPDRVEGILSNMPIRIPRPRQGDQVSCPLQDISDWGYKEPPNDPVGLFTVEIVNESRNPK